MIKITADSTADLGGHFDVEIMPLFVTLDGQDYLDGVDITPQMIFDKYDEKKILPKTAARSIDEYVYFFNQALKNADEVIHFCISSELSVSYNNALKAAWEINDEQNKKRVFVVDSRSLSSGIGLLVLKAMDFRDDGMGAQEIYDRITLLAPKVQCSFVVDTLDFLHKGGRCSALSKIIAGILRIRPVLQLKGGRIEVGRKFSGSYIKSVGKYIEHTVRDFPAPDYKRVFITHAHADDDIVSLVRTHLEQLVPEFENVILVKAGSTVSAHCGKGTLGILFINNYDI